jgi:hypothetical protein
MPACFCCYCCCLCILLPAGQGDACAPGQLNTCTTHLQSGLWYQLWWSSSMLMPRFSQQRSWKHPWHPSHTMKPGALFRRRRRALLLLLLERPQGHHQRRVAWLGRMSFRQKEQRALHHDTSTSSWDDDQEGYNSKGLHGAGKARGAEWSAAEDERGGRDRLGRIGMQCQASLPS